MLFSTFAFVLYEFTPWLQIRPLTVGGITWEMLSKRFYRFSFCWRSKSVEGRDGCDIDTFIRQACREQQFTETQSQLQKGYKNSSQVDGYQRR